jgi:transcriptional regulator of acetoin/glycerol metabolism
LANIRLSSESTEEEPINFESWEYNSIIEALKRNKFVVSKTSSDLGISRSTLIRKMKKYNIK